SRDRGRAGRARRKLAVEVRSDRVSLRNTRVCDRGLGDRAALFARTLPLDEQPRVSRGGLNREIVALSGGQPDRTDRDTGALRSPIPKNLFGFFGSGTLVADQSANRRS